VSGSSPTRYPWGDRPLGREDILDREQVGELLGLRPSTVDDLRRRGDLPAIRLGRHRRFLRADVERFVVANRS
jgi:excisionase family DNA binding protein